jgi:hypothetical protein
VAEKGRVYTGARARFLLNGKKVGYARNVALGEALTYERLKVLDNIETEEHVPTDYDVPTFTAGQFKIVGETLKSLGYFPSTGANTEEHLQNILTNGDLTATLEDTKTGKIIATVEQVKVASYNWTIDAVGIVGEDVNFVAIRVKDESEV